ncbi:MAG: 4Fe-4S binding protein [Sedimentibacter sp.]
MKKNINKKIRIRPVIQTFFFALIALISVNHALVESGRAIPLLSSASLHALCPFGGVVTLQQFFTSGDLIQKIHESSIVLMTIAVFLAILFGPVFCGWICPLGTVQEWVGKLGRKIFNKKYNSFVPLKYDKYLRFARYFVLAWVLYVTTYTGKLVFQEVDPYFALFNFWSSEVAIGSIIILSVTLIASLFVERPWCKYACPFGAVMGISNFFRIFKIKRNTSTCISCGACDRACPMNIKVSDTNIVRDHQCISCMKCTSEEACPIDNTVELTSFSKEKGADNNEN